MQGEVARFEVPRATVNFEEERPRHDLSGREKLTVLKYLALEDILDRLGVQRFGKTTTDNILLKPVRDWVSENWDEEFVYDLSKRNIPITFRTSLALALFTTKITEYLTKMGTVEIYASRRAKKIFEKNKLPVPEGLAKIDYASLSPEAKRELAILIVDNLLDAEIVAKARLLFPNGVSKHVILYVDSSSLFDIVGVENDVISFNEIGNLGAQSTAAGVCVRNYVKIKSLEEIMQKIKEEEQHDTFDEEEEQKDEEEFRTTGLGVPYIKYDKGTTLFDKFPFKEGETKEDLIKVFKKITIYGSTYRTPADEGDYLDLTMDSEGNLKGEYVFTDFGFETGDTITFNALTDDLKKEHGMIDDFRCKAVYDLVRALRDELDSTKKAIQLAKTKYNRTSFTVELGFLAALTSRNLDSVMADSEATKKDINDDTRLAKEAEETAGFFDDSSDLINDSEELVVYSNKPIDDKTLDLDYKIFRVIDEDINFSMSDISAHMMGARVYMDNIGDWLTLSASLLKKFQDVMVNTPEAFALLGIPQTNDAEEVKRAYRAIAKQTHPDALSHLSPEKRLEAAERFKEATEAHDNILSRIKTGDVDRFSPTYYLGRISELFKKQNFK